MTDRALIRKVPCPSAYVSLAETDTRGKGWSVPYHRKPGGLVVTYCSAVMGSQGEPSRIAIAPRCVSRTVRIGAFPTTWA